MDSLGIYQRATRLVKRAGTRDVEQIARELGIKIYDEPSFDRLLGMYTFRWNHRIIILNPRMDPYMRQMVIGHELGHDSEQRDLAKASKDGMKEFSLFHLNDDTEYVATAFSAHLLLSNDDVYNYAKEGYTVTQVAQVLRSNVNLVLVKMREMNKLGYDFNNPYDADSRFFRKIQAAQREDEDAE